MLENPPIMKRCTGWQLEKLLSEYDHSKRSKDLRRSVCKDSVEKRQNKNEMCVRAAMHAMTVNCLMQQH